MQLEGLLENLLQSPHSIVPLTSDTIQLPDSTVWNTDFFHLNKHMKGDFTPLNIRDLVEELVGDDQNV